MRNFLIIASILLLLLAIYIVYFFPNYFWLAIIPVCIGFLGLFDAFQKKHTLMRNFPILGRTRWLMEWMRPKMHQYFVESDTDGKPFNRLQRSLIYQRAKKETDTSPFGTQLDVYAEGYEWIAHSMYAKNLHHLEANPRVKVGGKDCSKPYMASIFNISAMSFGSLSQNAVLALNHGAKIGGFAHNTGEGGLSPYHLEPGGDIIWNIGTGYFSCRSKDGKFSEEEFAKRAILDNVKMIEIKFSQGAKPGHGGILPAQKVTKEIADIRLVEMGNDIVSPPTHSAFTNPQEFVQFFNLLRKLSGGKPVGMKLCVGNTDEFKAICQAMVQANSYLDFITVDGGEGGTGAAPLEFTNNVGMPLQEALVFVHDCLTGFGIRQEIKIICSGKIVTGFDIVRALSLGADMCNSARGMMFALGCIQALECNTNTCPTGIATQNKQLMNGLVVEDKKTRVANFHKNTVKAAMEIIAAAGLEHPEQVDRTIMYRRTDNNSIMRYSELFPEVEFGKWRD